MFHPRIFAIPDFELTCVFPHPKPTHVYVGTEDGKLGIVDLETVDVFAAQALLPGDTIHTIAECGDHLLIASLTGHTIWSRDPQRPTLWCQGPYNPAGMFQGAQAASGQLVMPAGENGLYISSRLPHLLTCQLDGYACRYAAWIHQRPDGANVYVLGVLSRDGTPILLQAVISATADLLLVPPELTPLTDELDFASIVSLSSANHPGRFGVLTKEGRIVIWQEGGNPRCSQFRLPPKPGVANYKLLRSGTDLFVLTSESLQALPDVLREDQDYKTGFDMGATLWPLEAVDATVVNDEILVVLADGCMRVKLTEILGLPMGPALWRSQRYPSVN